MASKKQPPKKSAQSPKPLPKSPKEKAVHIQLSGPDFSNSVILHKKNASKKLKTPAMIVGLPGIGLVSKLSVEHLISEFKAQKIATMYSPHFPNQVLAMKNGSLRMFSIRFYAAHAKNQDLLLVKGDLQPLTIEGQYEVASKVLQYAASLGSKNVISMAGYAINKQIDKPAVYCNATTKKQVQACAKLGAKQNKLVVPIVGLAGMIPAMAKNYGATGTCLLVETPGNLIDPKGAKTLVDFLSKMIGQPIDTKNLETNAKKAQQLVKALEQQAQTEAARAGEIPALPQISKHETLSYIR